VALDAWLFFVNGVAQSVRDITYDPVLFLLVFGLVALSAAFHECGHATACRYGGATPGVMGAGIYVVYPAFFSDVTDVYRLGKLGRVRTDMGGIYFNMIFSLLTVGAYFLTGFEPLLAIIMIQNFEMLHQLLPFLRLDGYYIVADITGIPDLFARIRPILRSLIPGREPDATVTALKPWVRVVVTAWVLTIIPVLIYLFLTLAITVPRLIATAWDSFWVQYDKIVEAFSGGEVIPIAVGSIQILFLILPLLGMTYTFGRLGKNLGLVAWRKSEGKPALRTGFASTALVAVGLMAFILWPNGDYKPIQPDERGTIQASLASVRDIPTGRPGLTPEREAELNGAPTLREQPDVSKETDINKLNPATDEPASGSTPSIEQNKPDPNVQPDSKQSAGEQTSGSRQGKQPNGTQSVTQSSEKQTVDQSTPKTQVSDTPNAGESSNGTPPGAPTPEQVAP
jgi:putative peptide zinc metalloprotease protein